MSFIIINLELIASSMFSLIELTIWQLGIELQGFELHHSLTTIINDGRDYSIRFPIQKAPSGPPCPAGVI